MYVCVCVFSVELEWKFKRVCTFVCLALRYIDTCQRNIYWIDFTTFIIWYGDISTELPFLVIRHFWNQFVLWPYMLCKIAKISSPFFETEFGGEIWDFCRCLCYSYKRVQKPLLQNYLYHLEILNECFSAFDQDTWSTHRSLIILIYRSPLVKKNSLGMLFPLLQEILF